jgi:putative ABC transport system substrate-binding protein
VARPGGNATGFLAFDYSISAKSKKLHQAWRELGSSGTPQLLRRTASFAVIQAAAPSLRVEVTALNVHDTSEIESVVNAFAQGTSGGLIVTASVSVLRGRNLMIGLAAKHKLPAIYYGRHYDTTVSDRHEIPMLWRPR